MTSNEQVQPRKDLQQPTLEEKISAIDITVENPLTNPSLEAVAVILAATMNGGDVTPYKRTSFLQNPEFSEGGLPLVNENQLEGAEREMLPGARLAVLAFAEVVAGWDKVVSTEVEHVRNSFQFWSGMKL